MQKATQVNQEYTLLPVPTEVLEEVGIDAFSTVQFSVARGKLIIEPIDTDMPSLKDFLEDLSEEEQYASLVHLSVLWAEHHDQQKGEKPI